MKKVHDARRTTHGLGTDKQAIRQFYIAKGSSAELYTQITISRKIGYLTEDESKYFLNECQGISAMLMNLIKSRLGNSD